MKEPWLTFDPVLNPFVLGVAMIALGLTFFWMEYKRILPYRTARYISLAAMLLALLALLIRPAFKTIRADVAILLTPNFGQSVADSLLRSYPNASLFRTPEAQPYANAVEISDRQQLAGIAPQIRFVLGEGLSASSIDLINNKNVTFIPGSLPSGVVSLALSEPLVVKRKCFVEGIFNNPPSKSRLYLEGPGGRVDSATLQGTPNEFFQLTFIPKQAGRFLYTLTDGNTWREPVPVVVREEQPMDILVIQNYPTFELRNLKEFLGKRHRVVVRSQLSRNKFRHEFINTSLRKELNRISQEALSPFDLLIIDSDAYHALSVAERKQIQLAVEEGLGSLVTFNELPGQSKDLRALIPATFKSYAADTALFLSGAKRIALPSWPVTVTDERTVSTIIRNKNRILSGYESVGLGKAGFQLLQSTYQLNLAGDSTSYNEIWASVVTSLARKERSPFTVSKPTFPLYEDEPFFVSIASGGPVPSLLHDGVAVSMSEDLFIDDVWRGNLWAGEPGWHTLTVGDSLVSNFYVCDNNQWRSLESSLRAERTSGHFKSGADTGKATVAYAPVPSWMFFVVLLLSSGFLWLAPKL